MANAIPALLAALTLSVGDGSSTPTPITLSNYMPDGAVEQVGVHGTTEIPFQSCSGVSFVQPASGEDQVRSAVDSFKHRWPLRTTRHEITVEQWADILRDWANLLDTRENLRKMERLMMRCFKIEKAEARAEIKLTLRHMRTYDGNSIRNMRIGQAVEGEGKHRAVQFYRAHGICGLITPYNFPLEIPGLQIISALICGNLLIVKGHELTGAVIQAFLEIGFEAGLPRDVVCLLHGEGKDMEYLGQCEDIDFGVFTGSSAVYNLLARQWGGEKSGVNPCIVDDLGTLNDAQWEVVHGRAWTDRYNRGGQVCARRALEFVHANTVDRLTQGLLDRFATTPHSESPILTWSNERLDQRVTDLMAIPGAQLVFGGKRVREPENVVHLRNRDLEYGYFENTLIRLPLSALSDPEVEHLLNQECFGPIHVQIIWETDEELTQVLEFCSRITHKLTAGVVTDRKSFWDRCKPYLRRFGVVYWGIGAGTKGAPDWMGFGPSGANVAWIGGRPVDVRDVWTTKVETCERSGGPATFVAA